MNVSYNNQYCILLIFHDYLRRFLLSAGFYLLLTPIANTRNKSIENERHIIM